MWESVALTLAGTAGNNIGKVLQKKGTLILPPLSLKLKVVKAYASNQLWISGFLMDMCGAALMLTALSQAPVSVVQPIAGCGLAILCVFSHFYLKEVMNGLDWIAITLAGLGTIGVGVGGEEQKVDQIPLLNIPWLVLSIVILFVLLNTWLHMYKKQRREQELTGPEVIEEIIYGLESGILFGISSVISKMGFVMSEMGFPKIVVPAAISCSVCCSAVGFVYQTRGLKHGRAIVVSTCTSVASIVSGVVAGMIALDKHLPKAPTARFFLLLGWFFIITGVILLVSSTRLIARLPRPVQKFLSRRLFGCPHSAGQPAFFFPAGAVFFSHKNSYYSVSRCYRANLMSAEQLNRAHPQRQEAWFSVREGRHPDNNNPYVLTTLAYFSNKGEGLESCWH